MANLNYPFKSMLVVATAICLVPLSSRAAVVYPESSGIEIGKKAPDFSLPDQTGKIRKLSEFRGRTVILAFYPKDFTNGCTCELRAFRDAMQKLTEKKAIVLGISADTAESHAKFAEQESITFPLLADPDKRVISRYGALGPNGLVANRYTFVIDPHGKIANVDYSVNAQFDRNGTILTTRHADNIQMILSGWQATIGTQLPNASLRVTPGGSASLLAPGKAATVVVFLSSTCPASRVAEEQIRSLSADPAYAAVQFLGVFSGENETESKLLRYFGGRPLGFTAALDPGHREADHFAITVTPTAWLIDSHGIARYRGAIVSAAAGTSAPLREALDSLLAAKPITHTETEPAGCKLNRGNGSVNR